MKAITRAYKSTGHAVPSSSHCHSTPALATSWFVPLSEHSYVGFHENDLEAEMTCTLVYIGGNMSYVTRWQL